MDFEDEIESRKKLDEQKKKLQKELRDVKKLSCVPKKFQKNLKSNLQQQLHEVEQRKPEHQKVQKRSQKVQSIQDKRRNLQKDSTPAEEEERLLFLSNKVDKNKMADAEMAAELQSLQAGEERRGSNASQTCDCSMEALW